MNRVLALVRSASDPRARRRSDALAEVLLRTEGWTEIVDRRGMRLFAASSNSDIAATALPNGRGIVLGVLFREVDSGPRRVTEVSAEEIARWCDTDGAALTQSCWGGYLAVLLGSNDRLLVIRDPAGARPCFVSPADDAGVRIVFTHAQDYARIAPLPDVDEQFLAMFLAQPRLVTERTGFKGVREILAGECVIVQGGQVSSAIVWRPPPRDRRLRHAASAVIARQLRQVVERNVAPWAQLGLPILHRLSGGLDSGIALAALTSGERRADIRCITERPEGYPEGDEAEAARAVACRLGVPLIEANYRPEDMRYDTLVDAPISAKPSLTELSQADDNFLRVAGEMARPALLTSGQGGDQVFYRSNAICLAADGVRDRLSPTELIGVALNAARASRHSVWPVLAHAIEYGLLRNPSHYVRKVLQSAATTEDEAVREQAVREALEDDWVRAAGRRGPGEVMRALLLSDLQYYHGPGQLGRQFVLAPVLALQPIIEFCCSIPTYRTIDGGRDRGLARLAFADKLPASAVDRRRKGNTTRFHAAVAAANAPFMRDMLCAGELEQRGLFRSDSMTAASPTAVLDFSAHLVAELWLRKVKALRSSADAIAERAPSF
jgi:asparagine synthase (glutamine-hydrolysing)